MFDYQSSTHAKCIIAGEHSVLRRSCALVFPFTQRILQFNYQNIDNSFSVDVDSEHAHNLTLLFQDYVQLGKKIINRQGINFCGNFFLKNTIPVGMGLGFSAALCVSLAKWFTWKEWLNKKELFSFAHDLENKFHGKSSGLDIAGVLSDKPILFSTKKGIKIAEMNWLPNLYISRTSSGGGTKECVKKVEDLIKNNPELGRNIDLEMAHAVDEAVEALKLSPANGVTLLAKAITRAGNCFKMWQLITPAMQQQMDFLLTQGALAVKPTGSGGGGCILSLWKTMPPALSIELIAVN